MKIIFFGSDKFVLPILQKLHPSHEISLILTTEKLSTEPISLYATESNIPFLAIRKFNDEAMNQLTENKTDVAVLAYFGLILPQSVLDLFPKGIINVHPSLLPKFRGPTPVQSAMLAGDKETGVSIIRLDNEVDHGPLLAQEKEAILPTDTDETLHKRLFEKGANLLLECLPKYIDGRLNPIPQDHTKATFTQRLTRDSGYFDSSHPPTPEKLQLMIRAYYPWPGVWTTTELGGKQKRIKFLPSQSHPERSEGSHQFILHVQDKKPMSYKDFLNGYPEKREWVCQLGLI